MPFASVLTGTLAAQNLVLKRPGDLSSVVIVDFGFAKAARAREKMQEVGVRLITLIIRGSYDI